MANGRFIAVVLSFAASLCAAQDIRLTQRTTWPPEEYADGAFGVKYRDFGPTWNSEPTNDYELQTVEELEAIDDQCTLYKAKLTQKELYFQYVRYKVEVPDLNEFTLCIWMRSDNLSNDHTILSYAVDGQPQEIRSWLSNTNRSSYFNLAVGGTSGKVGEESVHLFSINYPFRRRRWYHTCQSWSGITGNWLVYVEGERIGAGNSPATKGRVIRGGGVAVTGQTQHQTGGGFIEKGGVEGEVTLFSLYASAFPKPIREADSEGRRFYRSSCDGLCKVGTPYSFNPSIPQPSILPTQTSSSLDLSLSTPVNLPEHQQSTVSYYSVREESDLFDIQSQFPTFQPASSLHRQVIFQATPVDNGGVQLFSATGSFRVARSLDNFPSGFASPENVADVHYGNFESKRLDNRGGIVDNLGYQQQGLFQPALDGVPQVHQYGGSPLLRYAFNLDTDTRGGQTKSKELNPGEVADLTLPYDGTEEGAVGILGYGFGRDLKPVIDWRTALKKLYAGAMWIRANPVCRKF